MINYFAKFIVFVDEKFLIGAYGLKIIKIQLSLKLEPSQTKMVKTR